MRFQQHLPEPAGIAEHPLRHVRLDVAGELDAFLGGAQRQDFRGIADGLAHLELGAVQIQSGALRSSRSRGRR